MQKKMIALLMTALFFTPIIVLAEQGQGKAFHQQQKAKRQEYRQQQQEENKTFRESLKGKTPEEKTAAIEEHRGT